MKFAITHAGDAIFALPERMLELLALPIQLCLIFRRGWYTASHAEDATVCFA